MSRNGRKTKTPFDVIAGRNAVLAALAAGTREVASVVLDRSATGPAADEVRALAARQGVRLLVADGRDLDRLAKGDFHQGFAAYVTAAPAPPWEELVARAASGRPLLVLDHIEDPRNLGAAVRSAAAFGAGGVLIPSRRQAAVTPVVAKTAEGGLEHVPVITVTNVHQTVRRLKEAGVWCYGLERDGEGIVGQVEFAANAAFILGGEDAGLGKAVRRDCDVVVAIPLPGGVTSLNVAATAAITLYEYRRQHGPP